MTILDDAIRAIAEAPVDGTGSKMGVNTVRWNGVARSLQLGVVKAAARALYPRDPSAATLEATLEAMAKAVGTRSDNWDHIDAERKGLLLAVALAAYRANPLWIALWGDKP